MSQYFPKPYKPFKGDINAKADFSQQQEMILLN